MELVKYSVTDAAISEMSTRYMCLKVLDPLDEAGFKAVHNARIIVKGKRCEVEKIRVQLKAEALKFGRDVDSEAKRITALLAPIEEHLETQERVVTDEKNRKIREAEEAARLKQEAEAKAIKDAEEARIQAEREAEQKKLAEERERLAAERAAMEAERQKQEAAAKAERDRLDAIQAAQMAEARKIAEAQHKLQQAEEAAQRAAELEQAKAALAAQAKADAEREAAEAKQREEARKMVEEAERLRLEAVRPDVQKIHDFGKQLCDVESPRVTSAKAKKFLVEIDAMITAAAERCGKFSAKEA